MKVAVLFPGQGSQFPGMADPWVDHPAGKHVLERASDVLGWDVVERSRDPKALEHTEVVQLAISVIDLAAFAVLEAEGLRPDFVAGHSLGEYPALVAAGAVDMEAGLATVAARGAAMGHASKATHGVMTALIGISVEDAHEICHIAGRGDTLAVANENADRQTVLSGTPAAVERAEELARGRGARAMRLPVEGAFHSPMMEPALPIVREAISQLTFHPTRIPIVPNVTGKPTSNPLVLRDLLSRHLVSPVRWTASLRAMEESGVQWFLESGPGDVLVKLARRTVRGGTFRAIGSPRDAAEVVADLEAASARA